MESRCDVVELLTDRVDRRTSPGILNTVSGTLKVAEAPIRKFVPSGGGGDLHPPDPGRLHRLVVKTLGSRVGSLMG